MHTANPRKPWSLTLLVGASKVVKAHSVCQLGSGQVVYVQHFAGHAVLCHLVRTLTIWGLGEISHRSTR